MRAYVLSFAAQYLEHRFYGRDHGLSADKQKTWRPFFRAWTEKHGETYAPDNAGGALLGITVAYGLIITARSRQIGKLSATLLRIVDGFGPGRGAQRIGPHREASFILLS